MRTSSAYCNRPPQFFCFVLFRLSERFRRGAGPRAGEKRTPEGWPTVGGEPGKCSYLYHYFLHPTFGWLYVRLQTWFPFEIQVGLNGREWLTRQLDRAKLRYVRDDNKFLWVQDWARAQRLLQEQLQTDWVQELDALQQQVHPLHPTHLGRMPLK